VDPSDRSKKKAWKEAERLRAREAFPLPAAEIAELFRALEAALLSEACDHTRRLTEAWAAEHSHQIDLLGAWLEENGGYCDCEVLANVAPHWAENRLPAADA
jgi:hypothetical protein